MTDFDVIVVGAGVVGLACAAKAACDGYSVLVVDRRNQPGQETSSRNSGVIHAGIYYPPGSLKAELCVRGRQLLYRRCATRSIPHRKLGKVIVATNDRERDALEDLRELAGKNGVVLQVWDAAKLHREEPQVRGVAALFSPESGIVDAHELMYDYGREAKEHGAMFCMNTAIATLNCESDGWIVQTVDSSRVEATVKSRFLVNAAGLEADHVAEMAGLDVDTANLRLHWCKGDYFALSSKWSQAVSHLLYPLPDEAGLGIHLTLDLGGRLIAGPDTEYVERLDYGIAEDKAGLFATALNRYFPGVVATDLTPDYSGIRPKLQGPGGKFRDFVIEEASGHGLPGLINLLGIESPGLTASEAIADYVVSQMKGRR